MKSLKNIVVGVDFSPASAAALKQGARLARRDGGVVHALHVVNKDVLSDLESALEPSDRTASDAAVAGARKMTEAFVAECGVKEGVKTDVVVGYGYEAIEAKIEATKADVVVLGDVGAGRSEEKVGSFTLHCLRHAPTNVLVVRNAHGGPFKRITACVDFSAHAKRVVDLAAEVALAEGASLDLLHVFAAPWEEVHYHAPNPAANPAYQARFMRTMDTTIDGLLDPVRAAHKGLVVAKRTRKSRRPADGVVDDLRETKADLAVVGTRGRSAVMRLLLGSNAERVLKSAPCSVLAVRPS
jgi:universal stress protein E